MYILDTSAIRSIKRQTLEDISSRHDVAISTISVLEIASHLHDSEKNESYLRIRGNFLKCALPRMINDPFWELSEKTGMFANKTRKDDSDVLKRLLEIVKSHDDIGTLNDAEIINPEGMRAKCKDIGIHISGVLKDEEDQFLVQVNRYAEKLKLTGPKTEDIVFKPEDLLACIVGFSNKLVDDPLAKAAVFCSSAPYVGYVLHRLYRYVNARPTGVSEFHIDRNDCEDAYICLHLDLMSEDVLVTEDQGTLEAIGKTMEFLNSLFPKKIEFKYAITLAEFIEQTKS